MHVPLAVVPLRTGKQNKSNPWRSERVHSSTSLGVYSGRIMCLWQQISSSSRVWSARHPLQAHKNKSIMVVLLLVVVMMILTAVAILSLNMQRANGPLPLVMMKMILTVAILALSTQRVDGPWEQQKCRCLPQDRSGDPQNTPRLKECVHKMHDRQPGHIPSTAKISQIHTAEYIYISSTTAEPGYIYISTYIGKYRPRTPHLVPRHPSLRHFEEKP